MSEQKCPHPDCKGRSKKYKRLSAHTKIVHEGGTIGGGSSGRPAATVGGDASFGSQIGRALDPGTEFTVNDITHSRNRPQSRSSVVRILPEGEQQTVMVFRRTGIPVTRKVGDKRIVPVPEREREVI